MSVLWNTIDISGSYDIVGIVLDGATYDDVSNFGLDSHPPGAGGSTYSGTLLTSPINWQSEDFVIGDPGVNDIVECQGQVISLPSVKARSLKLLGTGVSGSYPSQDFVVTYDDTTTTDFSQGFSDWAAPQGYDGESQVFTMAYRNRSDGGHDFNTFYVYGYILTLDYSKTPVSLTLPNNQFVFILSMNEDDDLGSGGSVGGGAGLSQANYNVVGSGGAVGQGLFVSDSTFLTTEDNNNLVTDSGIFIVTEYGDTTPIDEVNVIHNVIGSGGAVAAGTGPNSVTPSGQTYTEEGSGGAVAGGDGDVFVQRDIISFGGAVSGGQGLEHADYLVVGTGGAVGAGSGHGLIFDEVGSGGAVAAGDGQIVYIEGAVTHLLNTCTLDRKKLFVLCRNAYVPVITRCNQVLVDPLLSSICSSNNR